MDVPSPEEEVRLIDELLWEALREPASPGHLAMHLFGWALRVLDRLWVQEEVLLSIVYEAIDMGLLTRRVKVGDEAIPRGHEPRYWWTFEVTKAGRAWLASQV